MSLSLMQYLLGAGSGVLVGFMLGLVGGGGSILAVPLIVYVVGVNDPHLAIGTSALAVAANAAANLLNHARSGRVKWQIAGVFAAVGVLGAWGGSTLGKAVNGQKLLLLFALLMLLVGGLMLRGRAGGGDPTVQLSRRNAPALAMTGAPPACCPGSLASAAVFWWCPA